MPSSPPPRATWEALSWPGTHGARRGPRCHCEVCHCRDATLSSRERHLTNGSTNAPKDTLTDNKAQGSFRPLAAAKVWKRGLSGEGARRPTLGARAHAGLQWVLVLGVLVRVEAREGTVRGRGGQPRRLHTALCCQRRVPAQH